MLQSGAGVSVRKGVAGDAKALTALFRESWELAYRGIIPHLHLESMIRRRSQKWWSAAVRGSDAVLVLDVKGVVAGYATCGPARTRGQAQGEIYELYLHPLYQGLGHGERLFEAARHVLDQRQLRGLLVWSLIENTPACHFYWRRGGRPVAKVVDRIGRKPLEKVAFTWG